MTYVTKGDDKFEPQRFWKKRLFLNKHVMKTLCQKRYWSLKKN